MSTQTQTITEFKKFVSVPLSLEQVAFSLRQLSKRDLEILEELADKNFQKIILSRGKEVFSQYKKKNTISFKELQKDFNNV